MQSRWVLSQYYTDDDGHNIPVAADYGGKWSSPINTSAPPVWALAQVYLNSHQIEAMSSDDRVYVCPLLYDPRPISPQLLAVFSAFGATSTMSFSTLLATLSDALPQYSMDL